MEICHICQQFKDSTLSVIINYIPDNHPVCKECRINHFPKLLEILCEYNKDKPREQWESDLIKHYQLEK